MLPLEALRGMKPMLATPCGFGAKQVYIVSLFRLAWELGNLGVVTRFETDGESLITRIRARLLAKFLESDCTHLVFWDADVGARPEAIVRLLLSDKGVAVGVYPLKRYDAPDRLPAHLTYPLKPLNGVLEPDADGFAEVAETTTGLMCIKRGVFERMAAEYPELNYMPDNDPERAPSHWLFFDTMLDGKRFLSEDYAFCKRWRDIGGKVYVDAHSKLDHQGEHIFHGDLAAHLKSRVMADLLNVTFTDMGKVA